MNQVRPLHDLHPSPSDMLAEVIEGLSSHPRTLPCKYFYDARGSALFDQICELEEYYPTRTEISILKQHAAEISQTIGPGALVVEPGSGNSRKVRLLLDALESPAGYVPLDISGEHLVEAANKLAHDYTDLPIWPVCADFNQSIAVPKEASEAGRRLLFFPGSTIGNFGEQDRQALLKRFAQLCRPGGGQLLIGIDLIKDTKRLEQAYDDKRGVTAAFNRNLLTHINRALDANFAVDQFTHRALFNRAHARVEMHLVSEIDQTVEIRGQHFAFKAGETIQTENSYKFSVESFAENASHAGWQFERSWSDSENLFSLMLFSVERPQNS